MLDRIVSIIKSSEHSIKGDTLFCVNHTITDKECIEFLESEGCLENQLLSTETNSIIELELTLARLNPLGFYEDCETFILKNKHTAPKNSYYIYELDAFDSNNHEFSSKYLAIIEFSSSLLNISRHNYIDVNVLNILIFKENISTFIPIIYNNLSIEGIDSNSKNIINNISDVYRENDTEKKLLFINELISFINPYPEQERFSYLLTNITGFYERCISAHQFYLTNFSYNKLKIELDSKALEFSQKIQSVINDSQTKLIAIPTVFLLAFATMNFENVIDIKNISALIGILIFAILIQLFLSNQKSSLSFIENNIDTYKESFLNKNIEEISSKFSLVKKELNTQKIRLRIVQYILWAIPISLIILWLVLLITSHPINNSFS